MIIVKSQDGALGEYNYVTIFSDKSKQISAFQMGSDVDIVLGKYKTEERAKEVMAEIENFIRKAYLIKNTSYTYKNDLNNITEILNSAIFTMPKE